MAVVTREMPDMGRIEDYLSKGDGPGYSQDADRAAAKELTALDPGMPQRLALRRRFVTEAVRRAAGDGCRRVIDVCAGYPSSPPVHQAARDVCPDAEVLYVSPDPCALAAVRAEFGRDDRVAAVDGGPDDPETVRRVADERPAAVILRRLHLVSPEDAAARVRMWADAMPAGSRLIVTVPHYADLALAEASAAVCSQPFWNYGPAEVEQVLAGLGIKWPGVSEAGSWLQGRAWVPDEPAYDLAAVGVKRA